MNTNHTSLYDAHGDVSGYTKPLFDIVGKGHEEKARRVAACVNECEGLSDGDFAGFKLLGGIKKYIAELLDQRNKAEQKNAELLAALKEIAEYPRTQGHEFSAAGLRFVAREAIAKAGGAA
jgi:hypothetical protein